MVSPGQSSTRRHLLDIESLADADLGWLLERTRALAAGAPPVPVNATVANLFFEPSTRTRVSFELAAHRLGMTVVNIELDRSSVTKGESLKDSAAILAAMGVDALVVRHPEAGAVARLAGELGSGPLLINAGDGHRAHPSQALLDAATLAADGLEWSGATVTILGDIRHSRVARSQIVLFHRLGVATLRVAGPESMLPDEDESLPVIRCPNIDAAVEGADVIVCLRIQRERMDVSGWPDEAAFHRDWGLTPGRLEAAAGNVRVLHPGPVNRGVEIADQVADGPRSLILEQVRMGVFARIAIFERLLAPEAALENA